MTVVMLDETEMRGVQKHLPTIAEILKVSVHREESEVDGVLCQRFVVVLALI